MYPDDYTAISAIPYLRGLGYKVPKDMCVTGFDGIEVGSVMRPSITSTKQNADEIGREAARILLDSINKKEIKEQHIVVPTSLFKGDSVIKNNR
jgi:DNA-binding LacI/PurR family transcriptional regulator